MTGKCPFLKSVMLKSAKCQVFQNTAAESAGLSRKQPTVKLTTLYVHEIRAAAYLLSKDESTIQAMHSHLCRPAETAPDLVLV